MRKSIVLGLVVLSLAARAEDRSVSNCEIFIESAHVSRDSHALVFFSPVVHTSNSALGAEPQKVKLYVKKTTIWSSNPGGSTEPQSYVIELQKIDESAQRWGMPTESRLILTSDYGASEYEIVPFAEMNAQLSLWGNNLNEANFHVDPAMAMHIWELQGAWDPRNTDKSYVSTADSIRELNPKTCR